jgi:hypothetical protein
MNPDDPGESKAKTPKPQNDCIFDYTGSDQFDLGTTRDINLGICARWRFVTLNRLYDFHGGRLCSSVKVRILRQSGHLPKELHKFFESFVNRVGLSLRNLSNDGGAFSCALSLLNRF